MSTLNVANITDGTDTVETGYVVNGSAKAWVNFDGTGTIAIRESFNVASLTDNGTGDYTVTWSTSFAAYDYSAPTAQDGYRHFGPESANPPTSSSIRLLARNGQVTTPQDLEFAGISAFGDLA